MNKSSKIVPFPHALSAATGGCIGLEDTVHIFGPIKQLTEYFGEKDQARIRIDFVKILSCFPQVILVARYCAIGEPFADWVEKPLAPEILLLLRSSLFTHSVRLWSISGCKLQYDVNAMLAVMKAKTQDSGRHLETRRSECLTRKQSSA